MLPRLQHYKKTGSIYNISTIFKEKIHNDTDKKHNYPEDDEENVFYISLDSIDVHDLEGIKNDIGNNILLCDVRDHVVASKCLPKGVSGYWIRIFGKQCKYTFQVSLWKDVTDLNRIHSRLKSRKSSASSDQFMKVGELTFDLLNTGVEQKVKKKKLKKGPYGAPMRKLVDKNINGIDCSPSFCSKEQYIQIVTSLRECIENGKYELFHEMFEKFSKGLNLEERNDKELKLFLDCELSQLHATQGDFPEAKKLLQKVVESVISKSSNKVFLLNRGYLLLANTHVIEGNYGTCEECLNVIQMDKKNGMSFEDVGCFYLLHGIVAMHFAKSYSHMSNYLYEESGKFLNKAASNFENVPYLLNSFCRSRLYIARIEICKSSSNVDSTCFTRAEHVLSSVESYGVEKLSEHINCLRNIIKAELLYHTNNAHEGCQLLDNVQELAKRFKFYEEISMCDSIRQWWNDLQYSEFLNVITTADNNKQHDSNVLSDEYFGDESSG